MKRNMQAINMMKCEEIPKKYAPLYMGYGTWKNFGSSSGSMKSEVIGRGGGKCQYVGNMKVYEEICGKYEE